MPSFTSLFSIRQKRKENGNGAGVTIEVRREFSTQFVRIIPISSHNRKKRPLHKTELRYENVDQSQFMTVLKNSVFRIRVLIGVARTKWRTYPSGGGRTHGGHHGRHKNTNGEGHRDASYVRPQILPFRERERERHCACI